MNKYRATVRYLPTFPGSETEREARYEVEAMDVEGARLKGAQCFGARHRFTAEVLSVEVTKLPSGPERITDRVRLAQVADELGVRLDWHEPDEQEVTAEVRGKMLDNAGSWGEERTAGKDYEELHVVVSKDGQPRFTVNIATLLAWATEDKR